MTGNTDNNLELLVKISADTTGSKKDLQTQLSSLSEDLKGLDKIKLGINQDDVKALKDIAKIDFSKLKQSLEKPLSEGIDTARNKLKEVARVTEQEFAEAGRIAASVIGREFGKIDKLDSINDIERTLKSIDPSALIQVTKEVGRAGEEVKALSASFKQAGIERKIAFEQVKIGDAVNPDVSTLGWMPKIIKETDLNLKEAAQSTQKLMTEMERLKKSGEITNQEFEKFSGRIGKATDSDGIKKLNLELNQAVDNNKRIKQEQTEQNKKLKEQEAIREKIRKLELGIITAQNKDPKSFGGASGTNEMLSTLQKIDPASKGAANAVKGVSDSFDSLKASSVKAGRESMSVMDSFKVAMEKFPVWMAASTAFYGTVRSVRGAMEEIVNLDSQITVLRRVAGDGIDVNSVMKESIELASKLGNTITDVNEGFISFARQGFRGEDLSYLSEYATLLSNISEMSTEEASSILTASLKGFSLEVSEAARVVDSLNEVDNNYAITSKILAESLQRSAGAANTYQVSLEKSIGLTTAIGEVTRESGSVIGNSLKSIYSRITSIPKAVESLQDIGIAVKDGAGEMRSVESILDDVGAKWKDLSAEQQQNLGLQIAGRYQLSRFLIAMNEYDTVLAATETALNSQGSGYRENTEYLKSFEAQINMVKNAYTEAVISARDSGLGDAMVTGLQAGLLALNGLTAVIDKIGVLPVVIGGGSAAMLLFSERARNMSISINNGATSLLAQGAALLKNTADKNTNTVATTRLTSANTTASASIKGLNISMIGASSATNTATVATTGMTVALRGLIATASTFLLPVAGLMALGAAFSFVTEKIVGSIKEQKELNKEVEDYMRKGVDAVSVNKEQVDELTASYERLRQKQSEGSLTVEEEEEYLRVQNELAEIFPAIVDHIDSKGNSHLKTSEEIKKEKDAMLELLAVEEALRVATANDVYKEKIKNIKEYTNAAENASRRENFADDETRLKAQAEKLKNTMLSNSELEGIVTEMSNVLSIQLKNLPDKVSPAIQEAMSELGKLIKLDPKDLDEDNLEAAVGVLLRASEGFDKAFKTNDKKEFQSVMKNLAKELDSLGIEADSSSLSLDDMSNIAEKLKRKAEETETSIDEFGDSMEDTGDQAESSSDKLGKNADVIERLAGVSKSFLSDADELLYTINELGSMSELTAEQTGQLSDAQLSLMNMYPEITGSAMDLINKYDDLTNSTLANANSIGEATQAGKEQKAIEEELIALYPSLINGDMDRVSMIDAVINAIADEVKANDILLAALSAKRDGALTSEEETTLGQLQNVNARIENINAEIKALNLLAQNYNKISAANKAAQTALSLMPGTEVFRAGIEAMDKGITFNFDNQQAKLARSTAERIKLTDILSKSNEVMSRTTSDGNKAAKESAEKNLKDAKAKDKGSKATKDATKAQKDFNTELQKSIYLSDSFREAQEKINIELAKQNEIKAKNVQHSVAYLNALQKELEALHENKNLQREEAAHIRNQIATGNIQQTGIVKVPSSSSGGYSGKYAKEINKAASVYGIDPQLIAAVIKAESNFNPNVRSSAGAQGLMQLMPATAKSLGVKNSYDPEQNIMGGVKYLSQQLKAFGGDIKKALAAYNAGPGNVRKYGGIPPFKETQNYVNKVINSFNSTKSTAAAQQGTASVADYYLNNSAFKFASGFGKRPAPKKGASTDHMGIDLSSKKGTDIKAVRGGKVVANAYHDGAGNYVNILQDDGLVARYLHMDKKSPLKNGSVVKAGDVVGKVGSTGNSTGNHLHLEIRDPKKKGSDSAGSMGLAQDPVEYLKKQVQGISSGSQSVAEFEKNIDDLKSDLNGMSLKIFGTNEEIRQKSAEITEALLGAYAVKRNDYQRIIDYETTKLQEVDIESERYGKTIEKIIAQQKAQQKANKEEMATAQALIDSKKLSAVETRKLTDRVWELKNEIIELDQASKAMSLEKLNIEIRKMDEALRTNNYQYERSIAIMALYEEGSADYNVEAKKQIELLKEEQKAIANKRDFLQKSLMTENLSIETAKELGVQIDELSLSYWKLSGSIKDAEKSLEETNKKVAEELANKLIDLHKTVTSERRDAHMRQLEAEVDSENDRHEAAMNAIEREMEAENERHDEVKKQYDYEIEMEEKRHKKRMDAINKEFRAFERYVQAQLQEMDRNENTRTYDKDIDKLQEERNETQRKLNDLQGDDSYEAKAKKKELEKQLVDIDERLFERRNERELELRKDNYDDLLQKEKDKVEEIEENETKQHENTLDRIKDKIKAEDEMHDGIIKNLEKQKKAEDETHKNRLKNIEDAKRYWNKFYEDQLNNEREFARIREEIIKGNLENIGEEFQGFLDEMEATMPELEDTLNGTMQAVGTEIRKNLIDNLKEALQLLNEFNSKKNTSNPVTSPSGSGSSGGGSGGDKKLLSSANMTVLTGKFLNDILAPQEQDASRKAKIKEKGHSLAAAGRASGSDISSTEGFDSVVASLSKEEQAQLGLYLKSNGVNHVSSDYLKDYIRQYADKLMKSAAAFDTGGFTGSWGGSGKLGILHEEELILNKKDTSKFTETMNTFDRLHSLMSMPKIPPMSSRTQDINEGDLIIHFNVDKMTGDKNDVRSFTNEVGRILKRQKGGR
ncbi:phage tail tape measure protein [Sporosarcina sp. FSL W7-1283]|uniref:phage tail tape measure protein n=1 Tax=Sporosarcina sp. FSL W7-1283 TaxID=2921560 RepID=UPI0030FB1BB0